MAKRRPTKYTAAKADRHELYQLSVQNVESEIDFVDDTFKELRGRRAAKLREDFCGTALSSCEWVKRRSTNTAVAVDLDKPTLDWGLAHNVGKLKPAARSRITLLNRNVLDPGPRGHRMDVVLAMNFSYWIFKQRATMLDYFQTVRTSLAPGGIFFLDMFGGYETMKEQRERRDIEGKFTYIWDQARYNGITGECQCYIHFHFRDGSRMNKAFDYNWRLWTTPEIRDILDAAGFRKSTVYLDGFDDEGEPDGDFKPVESCDADPAWIAYIVAEK